jgi:hypothetical protein
LPESVVDAKKCSLPNDFAAIVQYEFKARTDALAILRIAEILGGRGGFVIR